MVPISVYLNEIEYSIEPIFATIWGERRRLVGLKEVADLAKVAEHKYRQAEFIQMNAQDADDLMMGVGLHWDTYFGEDKKRFYKEKDGGKLEESIGVHQFAVNSMSGALLQNARQGISIGHRQLANCPDGRMIGSQPLKNVIWQARDQATHHWEDGNLRPPVQNCFNALMNDFDPKFADYTIRNMAFDVIELLGWTDKDNFKNDLMSLA